MLSIFERKPKLIPFNRLAYSRDCHTHLLPQVDDGQFSMEECQAQLARMESIGVREVCFTSHVIFGVHPNETELLKERFKEVKMAYKGKMHLHLAAEYMVDELFMERISKKDLLPMPDDCILMDMSYVAEAEWINHAIFEVRLLGLTPILAHPERYLYLADNLHKFEKYSIAGAKFQLNLLSLSGVYGKTSMTIMDYLFQNAMYSYVGTDLHTLTQWERIRTSQVPYKYAIAGEELGLWQIMDSAI